MNRIGLKTKFCECYALLLCSDPNRCCAPSSSIRLQERLNDLPALLENKIPINNLLSVMQSFLLKTTACPADSAKVLHSSSLEKNQ